MKSFNVPMLKTYSECINLNKPIKVILRNSKKRKDNKRSKIMSQIINESNYYQIKV